jgi:hypothetical protein
LGALTAVCVEVLDRRRGALARDGWSGMASAALRPARHGGRGTAWLRGMAGGARHGCAAWLAVRGMAARHGMVARHGWRCAAGVVRLARYGAAWPTR